MNVAVRTVEGVDGQTIVLAAWCPTCELEAMPHDRYGTCMFCDTPIYGALAEREPKAKRTVRARTAATVSTNLGASVPAPSRSANAKPLGRPKRWTRSLIIAAMQAFHAEHGRTPTSADCCHGDLPTPRTVRREFGTHGDACDAAGLVRPARGANSQPAPIEHLGAKWTRAGALEAVQAFHTLHGYQPVTGEAGQVHALPSWSTAKRLFGSWNQMIAAAGFAPYPPRNSASAKTRAFRDRNPEWREQRFDGVTAETAA